jgi:DNA-binding NarL/FixJ family response regulator
MSTVLLVGEDELLQQTRAAVLRRTGAGAVCSSASSALAVQQDSQCDVVILCHSLPESLSATLASTIHSRWPQTRILQLTSARLWETTVAETGADAISSSDPEQLILHTADLLSRPVAAAEKPVSN